MHTERDNISFCLSVCPVCLSNGGIVCKRLDVSLASGRGITLSPTSLKNSKGSLSGALNGQGWENLANIALYLGIGTR